MEMSSDVILRRLQLRRDEKNELLPPHSQGVQYSGQEALAIGWGR